MYAYNCAHLNSNPSQIFFVRREQKHRRKKAELCGMDGLEKTAPSRHTGRGVLMDARAFFPRIFVGFDSAFAAHLAGDRTAAAKHGFVVHENDGGDHAPGKSYLDQVARFHVAGRFYLPAVDAYRADLDHFLRRGAALHQLRKLQEFVQSNHAPRLISKDYNDVLL